MSGPLLQVSEIRAETPLIRRIRLVAPQGGTLAPLASGAHLCEGTAEQVRQSAAAAIAPLADQRRIILSAGGGTPPGVPDENIRALCEAAG